MVLWNFDLVWKTIVLWKKTMIPWTKLWYYTENYGNSIYEGKNMVDYQRIMMEKTMERFQNN